jgi:hypothetical protein
MLRDSDVVHCDIRHRAQDLVRARLARIISTVPASESARPGQTDPRPGMSGTPGKPGSKWLDAGICLVRCGMALSCLIVED